MRSVEPFEARDKRKAVTDLVSGGLLLVKLLAGL
jgi:hypothetical protein